MITVAGVAVRDGLTVKRLAGKWRLKNLKGLDSR
jgi:hypothetical protein